ncbi:MAG: hypothetical protein ICV62_18780, partial [Cyanobacteria bacterium Co-bin13]|nr:hypothetical protein [Cyanobacteria bacterium Co-bin13]
YTAAAIDPFIFYLAKQLPNFINETTQGILNTSWKLTSAATRGISGGVIRTFGPKISTALSRFTRGTAESLADFVNRINQNYPAQKWIGKVEDAIRFRGGALGTFFQKQADAVVAMRAAEGYRSLPQKIQDLFSYTTEVFGDLVEKLRGGVDVAKEAATPWINRLRDMTKGLFGSLVKGFQWIGRKLKIDKALEFAERGMTNRYRQGGGLTEGRGEQPYQADGRLFKDARGRFIKRDVVRSAPMSIGDGKVLQAVPPEPAAPPIDMGAGVKSAAAAAQTASMPKISKFLQQLAYRIPVAHGKPHKFHVNRDGVSKEIYVRPLIDRIKGAITAPLRKAVEALYLKTLPQGKKFFNEQQEKRRSRRDRLAGGRRMADVGGGAVKVIEPEKIQSRWMRAAQVIRGSWDGMVKKAKKVGWDILGFLSEHSPGPSQQIRHNYEHTADSVEHSMAEMSDAAAHHGGRIGKLFGQSARLAAGSLGRVAGAGVAIGGAFTALYFSAQTITEGLTNMGVISEKSSEKFTKIFQAVSMVGAGVGVLGPIFGAVF